MADAGEPNHLAGERATAHFDVDAMKVAWASSQHAVEVADRMANSSHQTQYSAIRKQFGSQAGGPETQDAIEECRKLCGGHGYLNSSGLPELFAVYVPACTYEGDNVVLLLQVARFLMNRLSAEDWLNPATVKEVFEARALRMAVNCARTSARRQAKKKVGVAHSFSEISPDLLEAAVAHVQLIIVTK
ncbi:hypothetical protein ZWY2020_047433 [Hordeum vulgare]|nr:hypothetical protein ZWY2020_047433 [Hordeum vulgare]